MSEYRGVPVYCALPCGWRGRRLLPLEDKQCPHCGYCVKKRPLAAVEEKP